VAFGTWGDAAVLGLVEGLTEFVPVSSTGHLLLGAELLGFEGPPGRTFEVAIQFGAILAVVWLYRAKLFGVAFGLVSEPADRRFAANVTIAFLPALVLGFTLHGFIRTCCSTRGSFPWRWSQAASRSCGSSATCRQPASTTSTASRRCWR